MSAKTIDLDMSAWLQQCLAMARLCLKKHDFIPSVAYVYFKQPEGAAPSGLPIPGEIVSLDSSTPAAEKKSVDTLKQCVIYNKADAVLMITETDAPTGIEEIPENERQSPILLPGQAQRPAETHRTILKPSVAVQIEVDGGYMIGLTVIDVDEDGSRTFAEVALQEIDPEKIQGPFSKMLLQNNHRKILVGTTQQYQSAAKDLLGQDTLPDGVLVV